jgi:hypothetical protein
MAHSPSPSNHCRFIRCFTLAHVRSPLAGLSSPPASLPLQSTCGSLPCSTKALTRALSPITTTRLVPLSCQTCQALSNGPSFFLPITGLLVFFPTFEASPHLCKIEDSLMKCDSGTRPTRTGRGERRGLSDRAHSPPCCQAMPSRPAGIGLF